MDDMKSFNVIPSGVTVIIESGIESREQILRYQALGVRAFLVGTSIMKSHNATQKILELQGKLSDAKS